MVDVLVAGAGLAGLVAARHLAVDGHAVTLVEERDEPGGRVRSRTVDGYTCDRGFQVLFTAYPAVQAELDIDALDLRPFSPGGVICRPGSRTALSDPFRDPESLAESALTREVSVGDKLRTLRLRRKVTRGEWPTLRLPDRTIYDYLRAKGFSRKFVDNFAVPLYGGITLDRTLGTSANVFEYTFRAMAEGDIAVPAAGMGAITRHLAERAEAAGVDVRLGEAVESVERVDNPVGTARDKVAVETDAVDDAAYDAVVVATDPKAARELTGIRRIPTEAKGVVTQHLSLDGPALDAGDRIMLNAGGKAPNTVSQLSAAAPEYAPDGETLLVASFVGDTADGRTDEELVEQTRAVLASWYPDRSFDSLSLVATDRIEFAQFAQPPGIHARLPSVRDAGGPVYLAGDYTRWSSIQGALESGQRAARAIDRDFA
jgi:phytoene dehydrogenase-like protein